MFKKSDNPPQSSPTPSLAMGWMRKGGNLFNITHTKVPQASLQQQPERAARMTQGQALRLETANRVRYVHL